jgi:hypothetical protein
MDRAIRPHSLSQNWGKESQSRFEVPLPSWEKHYRPTGIQKRVSLAAAEQWTEIAMFEANDLLVLQHLNFATFY